MDPRSGNSVKFLTRLQAVPGTKLVLYSHHVEKSEEYKRNTKLAEVLSGMGEIIITQTEFCLFVI